MGTRLREETEFKPKPMVPIGGMPILWHIMKIYSHCGVRDFVLCLGYKGEMIKQFFLAHEMLSRDFTIELRSGRRSVHDGKDIEDWNISLVETGLNAMTGSRLKKAEKYVPDENFLFTYGDGLADINIDGLVAHHKSKGTIGTLTGVRPPSRFGIIKADKNEVVTEFLEKPMSEDQVNGGFCVFKKDIFDYVDADDSCVLETKPLSTLAKKRQLSVYPHKGFWHCMDNYRDYTELNNIWDSGKVPWKVW